MAIGDWSTAALCQDGDLINVESQCLDWIPGDGSSDRYRTEAKRQIEARLRRVFKDIELVTDEADVLDLIESVTPLLTAAIFLTLHLLCNDCSTGGDFFENKSALYLHKFNEEWPQAITMLNVDTDESGTIEDSEKYNVVSGVEFRRK